MSSIFKYLRTRRLVASPNQWDIYFYGIATGAFMVAGFDDLVIHNWLGAAGFFVIALLGLYLTDRDIGQK